ncbi:MAG: DnaB-like helicase C-terminal domain-containing protein [Candidatus Sericytochromatia bacterium]
MTDIKEILFEIYPRINRAEVFSKLNPEKSGSYYLLDCPSCNQREAYISEDKIYIQCNRLNKCGYSKSIWDYIQEENNFSNYETLKELARLAGYNLPESSYSSDYSEDKYLKKKNLSDLLESSLNYMRSLLFEKQGKEILDYLNSRGYTNDEIKQMQLGFFPPYQDLEKYLKDNKYNEDLISKSGLKTKNFGISHQLVIPYRDKTGMLKGFILRSLLSKDELKEIKEQKYKFSFGIEKDTLFNLNQIKNKKELIVVEGYLDCLIANVRGLKSLVGTGGSLITKAQLDNAIKSGFKSFTFALDNDNAGMSGTENSIKMIYKEGLKAYVLKLPKLHKDPDEFIKAEGIEAFQEWVKKAESAIKWLASYLSIKYDIKNDKERDTAIEEAINYAESIKEPLLAHEYLTNVMESLEIDPEFLELQFEIYKEKAHKRKLERSYRDLFKEANKLLEEDKISDIETFISEKIQNIKSSSTNKIIKPYTFSDLEDDISTTVEGLKTGYKSLDELLMIPQEAITIIAGRPSHGKTTFLLNLYINMINLYPEKSFLFFSYEETKKQLSLKVLNIFSEYLINEKQNLHQLENYIKFKKKEITDIEKAKLKLNELAEQNRLWIIDEPFYAEQLVSQISYLKNRYDIGAVFIDYIQKIKIHGKYSTRQLEVQKISETILEAAKSLSLPIILGAQLGRDKDSKNKIRLDNLREAGDIENDANLVIALNNEAMEKAQSTNEKLTDRKVKLKLHILKNRNGAVNEEVELVFDRPLLKIKEEGFFAKNSKGNW